METMMTNHGATPSEIPPARLKRCTLHAGVEAEIKHLKEGLAMETDQRERAFMVLAEKLDKTNTQISDVKLTIAKWSGVAAVLLVLVNVGVQVAMKFIQAGG